MAKKESAAPAPALSQDQVILQSEAQLQVKAAQARKKLMTKDFLFLGICLYKFSWKIDNDCPDFAGAYVRFKNDDPDVVEAGSIFLNGKLVARPDFTHMNLTWFLLHELLHILNGHGSRMGTKDRLLWNFATDHVIECFLKTIYEKEIQMGVKNFINPYGGIEKANIIPEAVAEKPNGTAEEIYEWILKHRNDFEVVNEKSSCGKCNGTGCPDCPGDNGDGGQFVKIRNKKTGKEYNITNPNMQHAEKRAERRAQAEARAAWEHVKERGNISAGFARYLDDILKVEIPWTELLEKAIKQSTILRPSGRSWRSVNKFFCSHGLTLPGVEYEEENEGVGTLFVGVDTSGSIGKKETQQFASIIMDSIKYFKKVRVIVHDVEVHQDLEYDKENILEFGNMLKTTGFKGGGGTSHEYLFKKVQELWVDDPDEVSMFISLTDGYSDIERLWENFEWAVKEHIPTYFVLTKNSRKIDKGPGWNFNQIQINEIEDD